MTANYFPGIPGRPFRLLREYLYLLPALAGIPCSAQEIVGADGAPLPRIYCHSDTMITLAGRPAGGYFSGCGVSGSGNDWHFNPVLAAADIKVFPHVCQLQYIHNGDTLGIPLRIQLPVTIYPPLRDTGTCDGQLALSAKTLYASDYAYSWQPAAMTEQPDHITTSAMISDTTLFVLSVQDRSTGCTGKDSFVAVRYPQPKITVTGDMEILPTEYAQLHASGDFRHIRWNPPLYMDDPLSAGPLARPRHTITYVATGTSRYGCRDSASVTIRVADAVFIPNAFTPNGDGLNDVFRIANFGYGTLETFVIYDRYGNMVFQTRDGLQGWDGNIHGAPAVTGTYYYYIHRHSADGTERKQKGSLQLIR